MSRRKQRCLAAWDCETDPFVYNRPVYPFINGIYDGSSYRAFEGEDDNIEQFIEYLRAADEELSIYAHNGGKFDFHFLLPFVDKKIKIINGRIAKMWITLDRIGMPPIKHEFRDSYLILPLPLSAHAKDTFDYKILEKGVRWIPENIRKTREYLKDDCLYLYEWVEKFKKRFGDKLTIASTAFQELKKTGYEIPKGNKFFDETMRPFYYGGRVEAIEPGIHKSRFVYYDINSAYPKAMTEPHPYGFETEHLSKPPENGGMYFAIVLAKSNGCLPIRNEAGSLVYPRDDEYRIYYATSWEIEAGLETGTLRIARYMEVIVPKQYKDFKAHVYKFYDEKKEAKIKGDQDDENFAKLMLNSPYGKFGADPSKYKNHVIVESGELPEDCETDEEMESVFERWSKLTENSGFTIWETPAPSNHYYNVATAASITGYVRAMIWRAICASKRPIYCDTDAVAAESMDIEEGIELGQWKLEANIVEAYIAGKKLYAFRTDKLDKAGWPEWKTAHKGAKLSVGDICKICAGEVVRWEKESPSFSLRYGQRFLHRNIKMTVDNE